MSIARIARYFALGLLLGPLALVIFGLIVTYVPPVAAFLEKTVWSYLSQLPIFSLASAILESLVDVSSLSQQNFMLGFMSLLMNALGDAMIIACCIFVLKARCTVFNRKWHGRFTKPTYLITLSGVLLGVAVSAAKEMGGTLFKSVLMLVVCIGSVVVGMMGMLQGTNFILGGTYSNRWGAFVIRMLMGIVGDVFDALCGVFIATTIVQCPMLVASGGNLKTCLAWIAASAVALFIKNVVTDLLSPK